MSRCVAGKYDEPCGAGVSIKGWCACHLKVAVDHADLRFFYSANGVDWTPMGGSFDASELSDERGTEGTFTGAFVGLCAQDLSGQRRPADFDFFEYRELPASPV